MPEFRPKKLRTITCEQFWPDQHPWPQHVIIDGMNEWAVWNGLHQSRIKLKPGDWVRVDTPNDTYPIDQNYMAENYEAI